MINQIKISGILKKFSHNETNGRGHGENHRKSGKIAGNRGKPVL
jgi:hypothetical protein